MKELNRIKKLDKLLDFMINNKNNGNHPEDDLSDFLNSIGVVINSAEHRNFEEQLVYDGYITKEANGFWPTAKANNFIKYEMKQLQALRKDLLVFLKDSSISGKFINVNEVLEPYQNDISCDELSSFLNQMIENGLIKDSGSPVKSLKINGPKKIVDYFQMGNKIFLKIISDEKNTEDSNRLGQNNFYLQGANGFNLSINSPGATQNNSNLSNADTEKLIDFFNQIRTEDLQLLSQAKFEIDSNKELNKSISFEKVIGIVANISKIYEAWIKK